MKFDNNMDANGTNIETVEDIKKQIEGSFDELFSTKAIIKWNLKITFGRSLL